MLKLSNSKLLKVVTKLLVLVLLAKLFSLAIWWYLPSSGIDNEESGSYTQSYKRIDFKNMLERSKVVVTQEPQSSVSTSISTIVLKGLYGKGKKGFAIVAKKAQKDKTSVISVGEVYAGYRLKTIGTFSVIFEKMGKEYSVSLDSDKKLQPKEFVKKESAANTTHEVQKTDITYYTKNPTKLWSDIAINEVFEGKKITGFRVDKVKPNSKIAELGLQKGDIMIRANNVELTSYKAAMDLYKKIDSIDVLELTVLRNNQEKEIIYEIR
ncbi:hypothetical protein [Sulfurimonas marina]|uniref:PDZ domain-containing protein n=1 Tax=Sulfurimonas marina TaxID=2590551 RepID=A0A7M1AW86_9BACT|nr:hypothetical protein [Sulfurimonas marina]QOP41717.1 hypothetical protein FJR03_08195 [Sulfurimonas marina]